MPDRTCPCGSGLPRRERRDARGIFLAFTCSRCEAEKMRGFRPEVLDDPNYEASEAVDED